jgi:hypothetical protein
LEESEFAAGAALRDVASSIEMFGERIREPFEGPTTLARNV